MPDITPIQAALADARATVRQAEQTVTTLGGARASAARTLELARRRGDAAAIADATQHLASLDEQNTAAQGALGDARQQVGGLLTELHQTVDPAGQLAALSSDFPVALLPVRLETRYFGVVNDPNPQLRVRIYPDDIHVDAHEPELTADELSWGQAFWRGTWRAADDEPRARNVWGTLINQAGPNRAAWVAKATRPLNQTDAPEHAIPEDADLPVAPVFPECPLKADTWTRPATARVLPDRWVAIAYRDGAKLGEWWSEPVAEALPVSLDPNSPEPAKPDPNDPNAPPAELPIDAGMRWMVDYEEAVKVGMGITIPLKYKNPLHIDQLLVLGVKTSADHVQGAELLGGLLDAHHYGNGLAIVRQGTPTNNSGEQDSGYAPRDRDPGPSFAAERGRALFEEADGSDGDRLTSLLGLGRGVPDEEVFAHVENAGGTEFRDAGAMNAALWPATWGYFLDVMLEGAVGDETIADLRRHFIDRVRGAGPLAALRIGRQPYGVLPAVSLSQLKPVLTREPLEQNLLTVLGKLREMWRDALPNVPRVGRTADIDADLVEVLGMDPQPLDYAVRGVTGPEFAIAVWDYMDVDVPQGWWSTVTEASLQATKKLGSSVLTPLSRAVFDDEETGLQRPLVVKAVSETEPLRGFGYINALTTMTLQDIRDENFGMAGKPDSLLYVLLRHAILLAYTNAAKKIGTAQGALPPAPKEPELVNLDPKQPTLTVWNQLDQTITAGDGKDHPLSDVVQVPALRTHYDTPELTDLLAAFQHLAGMPTAPLERALTQTLDLSACRLDAWITSLATNKLAYQRASQPRGVFVGGFGYVENLRPDDPRQEVPAPPGETAPVFASDAPAGHVHAPSMAHAATAAVLRSAHLAHGGATGELLSVDLSSARVRTAQWLIDGVRQGQPLGALLGYRFERGLHDDALDVYIGPFRQLAPLVAGKLSEVDGPVEAVAARNVVDGLRLQRMWKENGLPFGTPDLPKEGTEDHQKVLARLAELDDAVDSVSDAVVAESVYQAVQGNLLRSGASLDAVAAGDVPPPELEVARTPRTGIGLTHRLVTMLDPSSEPVWVGAPRAAAEPALDAWVGDLLGDPTRVLVRAVCTDTETGAVVLAPELSLAQLGLCPLDVVFATDGAADEQDSELARRFRHLAERTHLTGLPDTVTVSVETGRQADWPLETLSLAEFAHLVRAVRRLVTQARPLTPKDLSLPTDNAAPAADVTDLEQRAGAVRLALDTAIATLTVLLAEEFPDPGAVADAIRALGAFGVQGAVPTARTLDGLRAKAAAALVDASERAAHAAALAQLPAPDGVVEAVEHHVARIRAVLGAEFPVLPSFPLAAADELATAFADQDTLLAGEPDAPLLWLSRAARVRAGVGRFDEALRHAELLGAPETLDLTVGQLPAGLGERWVGLPLVDGQQLAGGRVSLVVHHPRPVAAGAAVCGLLLDEWAEVVPNRAELTGVVFQHDAPGARAPQSILLAVSPGDSFTWSLGALEAAVLETIELAKLRAVDSVSLGEVGHYLPGLYFAFNVANDTVSTSFLGLTTVEA